MAVLGTSVIDRDAALYLTIAQRIIEQGPQVAFQIFDWPWFIFLLVGTHSLLHLPLLLSATLWCALFMAGTCALMVDIVRQRVPAASYWACLVVLAMPAFNQFRYDILREFGFWFFCVLALWQAMRWQAKGGWLQALLIHLAIAAAALFRLEALMLLPALLAWQLLGVRDGHWGRILQFVALPALGVVLAAAWLFSHGGVHSGRVGVYLNMLDPHQVLGAFNTLSEQFGNSLVNKYSRDEAGRIVFFGLLASLFIKFVMVSGPFAAPFLYRRSWAAVRVYGREFRPLALAALCYVIVLMLFYLREQFLNSRYVSFLNLLAVPLAAVALMVFAERFPRLGKAVVVLALLVMTDNVLTLGAQKTHYVQAGHWLAEHVEAATPVYYDDGRIAYYAGRGYVVPTITREDAMSPAHVGEYRYFLVEARGDEPWLQAWLAREHKQVLEHYANRKGATVLVIGD